MRVTRISMISGNTNTMDLDITSEQILKYMRGALIQDAFPNLSAAEREFIMSGITEDEWTNTFGNEDEDDE